MATSGSLVPIVKFHQAGTVHDVTAYAIETDRSAVLIHVPGGRFDTGSYHYVPYCDAHKTAWDARMFAACPVCRVSETPKGEK